MYCKTVKTRRPCQGKYCRKCLKNRYGEDLEAIIQRAEHTSSENQWGLVYPLDFFSLAVSVDADTILTDARSVKVSAIVLDA